MPGIFWNTSLLEDRINPPSFYWGNHQPPICLYKKLSHALKTFSQGRWPHAMIGSWLSVWMLETEKWLNLNSYLLAVWLGASYYLSVLSSVNADASITSWGAGWGVTWDGVHGEPGTLWRVAFSVLNFLQSTVMVQLLDHLWVRLWRFAGSTLPYHKFFLQQRDCTSLRSSYSESLPFNPTPLGMLGKKTISHTGPATRQRALSLQNRVGTCGELSSHLFICAHCPVKTSSRWNWCSHDFGDGPSGWSQMWFMNLGGFALTVHFSKRNYQFNSQLRESAPFSFRLQQACVDSGVLISIETNFCLFFAKSSAFNFNVIGSNPFISRSFKSPPSYLKACISTLDKYFSSKCVTLVQA